MAAPRYLLSFRSFNIHSDADEEEEEEASAREDVRALLLQLLSAAALSAGRGLS